MFVSQNFCDYFTGEITYQTQLIFCRRISKEPSTLNSIQSEESDFFLQLFFFYELFPIETWKILTPNRSPVIGFFGNPPAPPHAEKTTASIHHKHTRQPPETPWLEGKNRQVTSDVHSMLLIDPEVILEDLGSKVGKNRTKSGTRWATLTTYKWSFSSLQVVLHILAFA